MTQLTPFIDQILHGNCLDWLQKMPENSIDLIFADPPYKHKCGPMVLEGAMANDLLAADDAYRRWWESHRKATPTDQQPDLWEEPTT